MAEIKITKNDYSWPTIYSTLLAPSNEQIVTREVGKGAFQLNAPPPTMNRTVRNKSKVKQQRQARKRAKK